MDGFNADIVKDIWSKLTANERIKHCNLAALEAERDAANASPDIRPMYRQVADQWHALAAELGREGKL